MKAQTKIYETDTDVSNDTISERELRYLERELDALRDVSSKRELSLGELNRIAMIRECFQFLEQE